MDIGQRRGNMEEGGPWMRSGRHEIGGGDGRGGQMEQEREMEEER